MRDPENSEDGRCDRCDSRVGNESLAKTDEGDLCERCNAPGWEEHDALTARLDALSARLAALERRPCSVCGKPTSEGHSCFEATGGMVERVAEAIWGTSRTLPAISEKAVRAALDVALAPPTDEEVRIANSVIAAKADPLDGIRAALTAFLANRRAGR